MKDPLKLTMFGIGLVLFTVGAFVAYKDATLDYSMGWWGGLAAFAAGLRVGMMWTSRRI